MTTKTSDGFSINDASKALRTLAAERARARGTRVESWSPTGGGGAVVRFANGSSKVFTARELHDEADSYRF